MRPAAVIKVVSAVLLLIAVAALGAPRALANDDDCVQQCADRWMSDKQVCLDTLNATLADLDRQAQECYNLPTPLEIGTCLHNVNVKRYVAQRDYTRCVSVANTVAWNCYRACSPSKSAP